MFVWAFPNKPEVSKLFYLFSRCKRCNFNVVSIGDEKWGQVSLQILPCCKGLWCVKTCKSRPKSAKTYQPGGKKLDAKPLQNCTLNETVKCCHLNSRLSKILKFIPCVQRFHFIASSTQCQYLNIKQLYKSIWNFASNLSTKLRKWCLMTHSILEKGMQLFWHVLLGACASCNNLNHKKVVHR